MTVTFLGTGTSQGVPFIGCNCAVCRSSDPRDKRLRCSVWIQLPQLSLVIDTGPDFRYQMLRADVQQLDAVLFTHGHKDHIAGLDDIRAYNYHQQKPMDIWCTEETEASLRREFSYVFYNASYPGIPQLNLHRIQPGENFSINGVEIMPIRVMHYKLEVIGFRIGPFSYITDANYIAAEELNKLRGSEAIVLNALRHEHHVSHFTLEEAIDIAKEIGAGASYFTHISHQLGLHDLVEKSLPPNMHLAYDGLQLNFNFKG